MPLNLTPQTGIALLSISFFLISKIYRAWKEYQEAKAYVKAYKAFKAQQEEQRSWVRKVCMLTVLVSLVLSTAISFFFPWWKSPRNPASTKNCPSHENSLSEVKLYIKK